MLKLVGAVVIVTASLGVGYVLSDNIKRRLWSVTSLLDLVEQISVSIELYRTPLEEIYSNISNEFLNKVGFVSLLDRGIYGAANESGLLLGDEEREIIRNFGDKIGSGTAEDMVKLCTFTSSRLRSIEEKLRREYPDKRRVYQTISFLAGASAVIVLI